MFSMFFEPSFHLTRAIKWMSIKNKKCIAFTLLNHAPKEFLKYIRLEPLLIRDKRNHVATKTRSCPRYHRSLTTTAIGASHRMIRPKSYLITPLNFRLLLIRLFCACKDSPHPTNDEPFRDSVQMHDSMAFEM